MLSLLYILFSLPLHEAAAVVNSTTAAPASSTTAAAISADCPRPKNDTARGTFFGASVFNYVDECYWATTCPGPFLYDPLAPVQTRWTDSGMGMGIQDVLDYIDSNETWPQTAEPLKDLTGGRLDNTLGAIFLKAQFICTIDTNLCGQPDGSQCSNMGAMGFNLITSFSNLFYFVTTTHGAVLDAGASIELGLVNSTFWASPQVPPPLTAKDFFNIVTAFLGGMGGAVGSIASDVQTVASFAEANKAADAVDSSKSSNGHPSSDPSSASDPASITAQNATDIAATLNTNARTMQSAIGGAIGALPTTPGQVLDLQSALAQVITTSTSALEAWADAMFSKGLFNFPKGQTWTFPTQDGSLLTSDVMMMEDIMINGTLLVNPPITNDTSSANYISLKASMTKMLYAQLAQYSWRNDGGIQPFITYDDAPCGKAAQVYLGNAIGTPRMLADVTQAQMTIDNRCYYLLGATPTVCKPAPWGKNKRYNPGVVEPQPYRCCSAQLLPGGNGKALNGTNFSGLLVSDFIGGSVATWNKNGQKNGGSPGLSADPSTFAQEIASPGVITLPVCDYRNSQNPGINCPDLTASTSCPLLDQSN